MERKITPKVYAAIIATGLMSFCGVLAETAMNITFPTLMKEFSISTNAVQWLTSIYLLLISIVVPLSAVLKKTVKIRKLFVIANLLSLVGLLMDAVAPNFYILLIGRAIQGVGTGIALPLMFNIIMEQVPIDKIGVMMGIGNLITGIAPALGPTLGGVMVSSLNWRWIFYILIPVVCISLILGLWGIEQKSIVEKAKVDLLSLSMIIIFFTSFIYGFSNFSENSFISIQVGGVLLIGILALGVLIWRSNHLATPILNLKLLKKVNFAFPVLAIFLIQMISLGNDFLLPNYVQLVNNRSAFIAGLIFLPAGFVGAIMSPVGGHLLDRFGARRPIISGAVLMIVSLVLFSLLALHMSIGLITGIYVIYMAAMGVTMPSSMTAALQYLDKGESEQGNAIINMVQQFAGAMGTTLVSMIVSLSQTQAHSKGALPTSMGTQHAFILLMIFAVAVLFLLLKSIQKGKVVK